MVFACDGKDSDYQCDEEGPDETRDGVKPMAKELQRETAGVVNRNIVANYGQHKEYEREL